jgi:hypothetical protein
LYQGPGIVAACMFEDVHWGYFGDCYDCVARKGDQRAVWRMAGERDRESL